jgi:hypothetical protein
MTTALTFAGIAVVRCMDKRVWASVEKSGRAVIRQAFEEALRRDPAMKRRWVVLVDGEPKQLRAVKAEARRVGAKVTIVADIVHVIEYIWAAARALFGQSKRPRSDLARDGKAAVRPAIRRSRDRADSHQGS